MNSDAGRFINHQKVGIFKQDAEFRTWHYRRRLFGNSHRRNAYDIPLLQTVGLVDTAFIDAHFAGAKHPINMALGDPLAYAHQEIVYPLIGFLVGNGDHADLRGNLGG